MDSELWKLYNSPLQKVEREARANFSRGLVRCARASEWTHAYTLRVRTRVRIRPRARAAWACADTHGSRLRVIPVEAYWSSSKLRRFAHAHKSSRKQDKYHRASPENPSHPPSLQCPEMSIRSDSSPSGRSTSSWLSLKYRFNYDETEDLML